MVDKLRQREGASLVKILIMRIGERKEVIELKILIYSLLNNHLQFTITLNMSFYN